MWKMPFLGAFKKGVKARTDGKELSDCPYNEFDTCRGGPTFACAFARAWKEGWTEQDKIEGSPTK